MVEENMDNIEKGETYQKLFGGKKKVESEASREIKDRIESRKKIAKAGVSTFQSSRKIIVPKKSSGFTRIKPLQAKSNEWSDLGLVVGSPFKNYESRSILPRSTPDRTVHPQERAEFAVLQARKKLFGERLF